MGGHAQQLRADAPRACVVVAAALSLWALAVQPAPARAIGPLPHRHADPVSAIDATPSVDGMKPVLGRDDHSAATALLTAAAAGAVVKKTGHAAAPTRPDGLVAGSPAIDPVVLAAHQKSAATMARTAPRCRLHWSLLAGIGQVESGNAHSTNVSANGDTHPSILGPVLDGSAGFAAIADTDQGRYDGNASWDRAVGPMQFIPSSWRHSAQDGNGDGRRNPNNVFDASLASANYLCRGHDLAVPAELGQAVYSYNHSWDYVRAVLAWTVAFRTGHLILPATSAPA
ncbi:MAG: lytic transglycosylase domain-containing protein, partial [Actinomycetota bacterium]|nr:lytic transglycosylase domain-containing protein [Actinomycetota bacterium]